MHKEIHEQPAVLGDTLRSFATPPTTGSRCPSCRSTSRPCRGSRWSPAAPRPTPAWSRATGSSSWPACRSTSTSARSSATAARRWRRAARRCSSPSPARPWTRSRRCARVKAQGLTTIALVNVPDSTLAREADCQLRTLAGPEIGVASTKAFTTQLATLACLALGAARARGRLTPEREARADPGARRGAGARRRGADAGRGLRAASRTAWCPRATCSTSAAARASRSRSRARSSSRRSATSTPRATPPASSSTGRSR